MTERNPALWLQQRTDHTAEQDRALLSMTFENEGVTSSGSMAVSQRGAGANMSVDVAAGQGLVKGDDNSAQGLYGVWNDATKNLTISAADGTNPRRDIIVARVKDAYYSGATNAFSLEVITGTPAGTPVDPTIPNNCLSLARVAVAAGATSITNANITDLRVRAYTNGHWNTAWGEVAYAGATSNQVFTGTTEIDITGCSVTWNAIAGRKYEVVCAVGVVNPGASGALATFLKKESGSEVFDQSYSYPPGAGYYQSFYMSCRVIPSSSGPVTRRATIINTGGGTNTITASSLAPIYISVKDIGPA